MMSRGDMNRSPTLTQLALGIDSISLNPDSLAFGAWPRSKTP
jgi:hypothetical protein